MFARFAGAPFVSSTAPFLHPVSPSFLVTMVRRVKLKLRRGLGCSVATGSAGRHSCPPACLQRPAFQVCWASGQDMGSRERERPAQLCPPGHTSCLPFLTLTCCCPSLQAVHCIVAYAAYIFYQLTFSLCGLSLLFQTGQWPQDREQSPHVDKIQTSFFFFLGGGVINC